MSSLEGNDSASVNWQTRHKEGAFRKEPYFNEGWGNLLEENIIINTDVGRGTECLTSLGSSLALTTESSFAIHDEQQVLVHVMSQLARLQCPFFYCRDSHIIKCLLFMGLGSSAGWGWRLNFCFNLKMFVSKSLTQVMISDSNCVWNDRLAALSKGHLDWSTF